MTTRIRKLNTAEMRSLGETDSYRDILEKFPKGIVSIVSDTWDLWYVITKILPQLHDLIMSRDGKLRLRDNRWDSL